MYNSTQSESVIISINTDNTFLEGKKQKISEYCITTYDFKSKESVSLDIKPSTNGILMIFLLDGEQHYSHHIIKRVEKENYILTLLPCKENIRYISILIPNELTSLLKKDLFTDLNINPLPNRSDTHSLVKKHALLSAEMKSVLIDITSCQREGAFKQVYLERKIAELLFLQLENITLSKSTSYISTIDTDRMYHARELIIQNITCPCSLVNLAKQVGTNEFKLKKQFKEIFGTTVFGYLNDYKMNKAKERLQNSDITITELADELGYKSQNHFSTAFKKHYGYSPSEVKKDRTSITKNILKTIKLIPIFIAEALETVEIVLVRTFIT